MQGHKIDLDLNRSQPCAVPYTKWTFQRARNGFEVTVVFEVYNSHAFCLHVQGYILPPVSSESMSSSSDVYFIISQLLRNTEFMRVLLT